MSWRSAVRSAVPLWLGWPAEALATVAENKAAAVRRAHVAAAAGSLPRMVLRAVRVVLACQLPGLVGSGVVAFRGSFLARSVTPVRCC
jgi:hypothetical protein